MILLNSTPYCSWQNLTPLFVALGYQVDHERSLDSLDPKLEDTDGDFAINLTSIMANQVFAGNGSASIQITAVLANQAKDSRLLFCYILEQIENTMFAA